MLTDEEILDAANRAELAPGAKLEVAIDEGVKYVIDRARVRTWKVHKWPGEGRIGFEEL